MIKRDLYYERIPTKSLREDVRYLGNILGKVIKKQEGVNFFKLVEKVRLLSKVNSSIKNKINSFKNLSRKIKNISPHNLFKLTRAFSHFMNFINIAESIDGARRLDEYENKIQNKTNKNIFIKKYLKVFLKTEKYLKIKFITLQKI